MKSIFQIWPAIDLIKGRCVRLYKGSFEQKTEYFIRPIDQARIFENEGATGIHIVDLDGARQGQPKNLKTIAAIIQAVSLPIEVGGGIRSLESATELFALGVSRLIIGTQAIEEPEFLDQLIKKFGAEKIVVSIDARKSGTKIVTRGWLSNTELDTLDFAESLEQRGVQRIIFTDIARDGTLTYPNFDMAERLINTTNLKVIIAGGVSKIEQIKILQDIGCEGAILGKAIYENEISVFETTQKNRPLGSSRP
jgi:phosphoribosylformimino-5-aminoimidazole carboxamide ribotide isomerase